jgi:hypothetical protein
MRSGRDEALIATTSENLCLEQEEDPQSKSASPEYICVVLFHTSCPLGKYIG